MLKTNNSGYKAFVVITLILLIAGLAITGFVAVSDGKLAAQVSCLFEFAALIYAAYYILSGYTKDAAKYYKSYTLITAVALLASLASVGLAMNSYIVTLLVALQLSIVLVLALGKDMGKKNSLTLCAAYLVICAINLAVGISHGIVSIGHTAIKLILAFVLTVMTVAKYIDKAARGSK